LAALFAAGAAILIPAYARQSSALLGLEILLFAAAPLLFLWLYRQDLDRYLAAFRRSRKPVVPNNEAVSTSN
jgi:hypothetical protein